jgi:hypothetical protein
MPVYPGAPHWRFGINPESILAAWAFSGNYPGDFQMGRPLGELSIDHQLAVRSFMRRHRTP